ncbi:MAG: YraN family protein [Patescibacteria group bacterium]
MNNKKQIGQQGELLAEKYLKQQGYEIIAKNYRLGRLELDIISKYKNNLIFVEVKTRQKTSASRFDNNLGHQQINNLKRALTTFCLTKHYNLETARLDLIVIMIDQPTGVYTLKHYPDIF